MVLPVCIHSVGPVEIPRLRSETLRQAQGRLWGTRGTSLPGEKRRSLDFARNDKFFGNEGKELSTTLLAGEGLPSGDFQWRGNSFALGWLAASDEYFVAAG